MSIHLAIIKVKMIHKVNLFIVGVLIPIQKEYARKSIISISIMVALVSVSWVLHITSLQLMIHQRTINFDESGVEYSILA